LLRERDEAAVMNVHDTSVRNLESAISRASYDRRVENLRRVTDLFVAGADSFSEQHLVVFDRLLARLIDQIESKVLAEIGERLSLVRNAPVGVVRNLAHHDEIAVAGPILTRSRLAQADLVDIAETKSQAHLMAISHRRQVDEAVTDVLVRRGSDEVVCTLAANGGAKFSETGMGTLADRAEGNEMLAEKVVQRADVPAHVFCRLLVAATAVVRERLIAVLSPEAQAEAFRVLEKVSGQIADQTPAARSYAAAIRRVLVDSAHGQLSEEDLLRYASNKQSDEAIATLSLLSSVPTEKIDAFLARSNYDSLLAICKAAGLSWLAARAVVQMARAAGSLSRDVVAGLNRTFDQLKQIDAQRMLQRWLAS
jgi:uncharacterized protein (DUF2336 family)